MPLSEFTEQDRRTVLLHLELIRNIIRGPAVAGQPPMSGDIVEVGDSYGAPRVLKPEFCPDCRGTGQDPNFLLTSYPPQPGSCRTCGGAGNISVVETYAEPDLDGGLAREATETASRNLDEYMNQLCGSAAHQRNNGGV